MGKTRWMSKRTLILVKHAETLLTPEVTAERWPLTPRGREQCPALARRLGEYGLTKVVASTELKAIETGQLVARQLKVEFETAIGLHEHDRSNVPLIPREQYEERMRQFFAAPQELVYGRESADEALARYRAAVVKVHRENPDETLAIVSHGTVMALLLAQANRRGAFELWLALGSPSLAVVEAETFALCELVGNLV